MTEPRDAGSIIKNAEQAAAGGDYSSAEDLLREAAALQEQTLGPHHPDLANTLNNLGIVCEITDNPIDAEHYFRRAYTIATETLAPDHPFVLTSRKNLHDFCTARGRPVELPPSPPQVAAWLEPRAQRAAPPRESSPPQELSPPRESSPSRESSSTQESLSPRESWSPRESSPPHESSPHATKLDVTPAPRTKFLRPLALGALGGIMLLIAILVMTRPWGGSVEETKSPPATAIAPADETPTPSPTLPPAEPTTGKQPAAKPPSTRREVDAVGATPSTPTQSAAMPTVVTAQICTALREWRCEAAGTQVPPGQMFFYTQVKSSIATSIEHRWYQGDRLRQAVQLRIQANPGAGYRTYSRTTISSESIGEWRVELRSADGAVLKEVHFTVR